MTIQRKWLSVDAFELPFILQGKRKLVLPDDAQVISVRDKVEVHRIEFLVQSKEYAELNTGDIYPSEPAVIEIEKK